jgi:hypothetical protein
MNTPIGWKNLLLLAKMRAGRYLKAEESARRQASEWGIKAGEWYMAIEEAKRELEREEAMKEATNQDDNLKQRWQKRLSFARMMAGKYAKAEGDAFRQASEWRTKVEEWYREIADVEEEVKREEAREKERARKQYIKYFGSGSVRENMLSAEQEGDEEQVVRELKELEDKRDQTIASIENEFILREEAKLLKRLRQEPVGAFFAPSSSEEGIEDSSERERAEEADEDFGELVYREYYGDEGDDYGEDSGAEKK